MKDRYNKILELLTKEKKIEVNELSQILGVSNVTIRKDLDALEEKGIIKEGMAMPSLRIRMISMDA